MGKDSCSYYEALATILTVDECTFEDIDAKKEPETMARVELVSKLFGKKPQEVLDDLADESFKAIKLQQEEDDLRHQNIDMYGDDKRRGE